MKNREKKEIGNFLMSAKNFVTQQQFLELERGVSLLGEKVYNLQPVKDEVKILQNLLRELEEQVRNTELNVDFNKKEISELLKDIKSMQEDIKYLFSEDFVNRPTFDLEIKDIHSEFENIYRIDSVRDGVSNNVFSNKTREIERKMKDNYDELKKFASDGKTKVANSITQKGVATSPESSFSEMSENILKIQGDGNIETENLVSGSNYEKKLIASSSFLDLFKKSEEEKWTRAYWSNGMPVLTSSFAPGELISDKYTPQVGFIQVKKISTNGGALNVFFEAAVPRLRPSSTSTHFRLDINIISNNYLISLIHMIPYFYQAGVGSIVSDIVVAPGIKGKEKVIKQASSINWSRHNSPFNFTGTIVLQRDFFRTVGVEINKPIVLLSGATGDIVHEAR